MKTLFAALLFSLLTSGCTKEKDMSVAKDPDNSFVAPNQKTSFTYLALGDSYTIGASVTKAESFPYQLQSALKAQNTTLADPKIIAVTGWTTDELKGAIKQAKLTERYDFVTLLIGVNNQYRGYPLDTYKKEFSELLQTAIDFANGSKRRVFVISIPDWGATPFGKNAAKGPQTIAAEIDAFNAANKEITLAAGVSYTDITPGSRNAKTDPALIAADGLHPSAKMYAEWVNALLPKVTEVLK
ncbi:lysophospholipase [Pedobacter yonginense]|uniref:Lysophospholipase n=1 Tax=Pedobacter yonginense TaxID=651869 RepID=A0A317ESB9_9SPHI|nr:SGNH/GDSL hydrolase family protein [Pedobacter yonginense]PWS28058.1 lysophospholipase [Pedobacter yonginense]